LKELGTEEVIYLSDKQKKSMSISQYRDILKSAIIKYNDDAIFVIIYINKF